MTTTGIALEQNRPSGSRLDEKMKAGPGRLWVIVFLIALVIGLGYVGLPVPLRD
ncbi:MAG TPA: hypothetical protein VH374_13055 [Polyangia bacterium]|jgi:hypothetical protein|nr:hypothetical protein [Polyangia bacterium]